MKTNLSQIPNQSTASLIFGGVLILIYPSLLTLEKLVLFLGFSLVQIGFLILAFYQLEWALIAHFSLLMALLITNLRVRA